MYSKYGFDCINKSVKAGLHLLHFYADDIILLYNNNNNNNINAMQMQIQKKQDCSKETFKNRFCVVDCPSISNLWTVSPSSGNSL